MIKVERILCPTDLSTESDEALRYAVALARIYEAKLFRALQQKAPLHRAGQGDAATNE